MATLAELRAKKANTLPTHTQRITLDQTLLADVERLHAEKADLLREAQRQTQDGQPDPAAANRKMAEGLPPRVAEINAELAEIHDQLRASEGDLLLRAIRGHEWQAWKDAHPPREDNVTDRDVAFGVCNATDLLNDLGQFAVSWNGEEFSEGDWDGWFRDQIAPGDLREIVSAVVAMHEMSGVRIPKSSSVSSPSQDGATA